MASKGNGGPYSLMGGPNGLKGPNGRGPVARTPPNESLLGSPAPTEVPAVVRGIPNMVANLKRRQANVTRRRQEANRQRRRINNMLKSRRNTYFTQRTAERARSPPRNHTVINVGTQGGKRRKNRSRK